MSEAATTAASIALYPSAGGGVLSGGSSMTVGGAVQILTIFGVSLGLRPDFLVAGMLGAVASIFLLNSVPLEGAGVFARISNMVQRFFVVLSSSVTSGYLAPLMTAFVPSLSMELQLGSAFVIGAGARILLQRIIQRYSDALRSTQGRVPATATLKDGD